MPIPSRTLPARPTSSAVRGIAPILPSRAVVPVPPSPVRGKNPMLSSGATAATASAIKCRRSGGFWCGSYCSAKPCGAPSRLGTAASPRLQRAARLRRS